ncbi:chromate efflux transporter [Achromobacter xylosoxidans]|uniref:chromate efflux transporter n=1 Tax=Alcaligenes xylosoxydans xylosoxydans TaxID=85698 RepID=UPI001F108700|nr:chromate efflux transporter [Achromobacter xylosoxidans]MCH4592803.1 chromate efflux transporter [Achromobacter xylosoxidans]
MPPQPPFHDEHVASKTAASEAVPAGRGSCMEVFLAFLRLGLTAFGGPVAHLAYFREEFVDRRRWLDDYAFSDLVALCQFLPGPTWLAFTLPSALAMILLGLGLARFGGLAGLPAVHGLKVAAVAVIAQAVWGMGRSLCPDRPRAGLAMLTALMTLALPSTLGQIGAIALGAVAGAALLQVPPRPLLANRTQGASRLGGYVCLALFILLLVALPLWADLSGARLAAQLAGFYRAGALVFGGGHVVLPLLQTAAVGGGMVPDADFLAGYGVAQAVPGPLFTFAAFLGSASAGPLSGWAGGLAMLVAIFLPGALLVAAALPFWESLRRRPGVRNMVAGVNAAVVGILLSALYDPVWTSAIRGKWDFALALALFGLLVYARWSPLWVVLAAAAGGWALGWLA